MNEFINSAATICNFAQSGKSARVLQDRDRDANKTTTKKQLKLGKTNHNAHIRTYIRQLIG